jgi:hypothetical protein
VATKPCCQHLEKSNLVVNDHRLKFLSRILIVRFQTGSCHQYLVNEWLLWVDVAPPGLTKEIRTNETVSISK